MHHPILPKVNRAIRNAIEFGLIDFWRKKYDGKVTKVFVDTAADKVVLKLENVILGFGAIAIGCGFGVIVFILEIWLHVHVQQAKRFRFCVIMEKLINDERYIGGFLPELPFFKIGEN